MRGDDGYGDSETLAYFDDDGCVCVSTTVDCHDCHHHDNWCGYAVASDGNWNETDPRVVVVNPVPRRCRGRKEECGSSLHT